MGPTDEQFGNYQNLINSFSGTVNKEILSWGRKTFERGMYGEGNPGAFTYTDLECLIGFNVFRTWPLTKHTDSGELDEQNMVVWLNREYLNQNNYLNTNGYFDFDPDQDQFIHRGIIYKCDGDSMNSQAKDDPLHIHLILVRQEGTTGTEKYN